MKSNGVSFRRVKRTCVLAIEMIEPSRYHPPLVGSSDPLSSWHDLWSSRTIRFTWGEGEGEGEVKGEGEGESEGEGAGEGKGKTEKLQKIKKMKIIITPSIMVGFKSIFFR